MNHSACFAAWLLVFAHSAQAEDWLKRFPDELRAETPQADISKSDWFEVVASKEPTAEYWLQGTEVRSQSDSDIDFFGQRNFQCAAPKHLYLVRAAYENGGTGAFSLRRFGSNLLISHGSLGSASGVQRSALIVCLDFQPVGVFSSISGAL